MGIYTVKTDSAGKAFAKSKLSTGEDMASAASPVSSAKAAGRQEITKSSDKNKQVSFFIFHPPFLRNFSYINYTMTAVVLSTF